MELASGYDRYRYLIVGRGRRPAAASQPGMSLVYHSGTSVNTDLGRRRPVRRRVRQRLAPRDACGRLLHNSGYPDNFIGDVGNTAYATEWARRVGDYLASVGADGVFIDDVLADIFP